MAVVSGTYNLGEGGSYNYWETKPTNARGAGPRGIKVSIGGVAKSDVQYTIDPNPHDNRKYNKKQQSFYLAMARKIVDNRVTDEGVVSFPKNVSVSWQAVTYELSR